MTRPRADSPDSGALKGERAVLQLVAEGNSSKEVATALGLSVKTIEALHELT